MLGVQGGIDTSQMDHLIVWSLPGVQGGIDTSQMVHLTEFGHARCAGWY